MHKRDLSPGERLKRGALFALLFTACGLIACGDDEPPAVEFPRIPREIIGPEARPARLFVPLSYTPSRAYPLVLMLHGYQVDGDAQDLVLGLRERVESMGFALLIPEGTPDLKGKQFWNAWEECCNFDRLGVDDVGYLSALVEEAAREIHVDAERVSIVGHSNGAFMAFRLACDRPDLFRRVASVAGSMPVDASQCEAREPVSILHIHGSLDLVVPYNDNRGGVPGEGHGIVSAGARDTVARWRESNGCPEAPDQVELLDLMSNVGGAETTASSWTSCSSGESVHFFDIAGGDHLLLGRNATFQDRIAEFLIAAP